MQAAAVEAERDEAVRQLGAAEARAERLQALHQETADKLERAREQSFGGGQVRSHSLATGRRHWICFRPPLPSCARALRRALCGGAMSLDM